MIRKGFMLLLLASIAISIQAQDSTRISFHFQLTSVSQWHLKFHSPYQGTNSLIPDEGIASSLTSTVYLAAKPWNNGLFILDPEVAGGKGLSGATGLAGSPNGEIFRIGNPKPTIYLARLILEQKFPLHNTKYISATDDANTLAGAFPVNYFKIFAGRFCLADYFDNNPYSHDPRSQFLNWSFMSGGAWDYAADTRGYTWGLGGEWKKNAWRAALAFTLEPVEANGLIMDLNIKKAFASQAEVNYYDTLNGKPGQVQVTVYFNKAHMGNYAEALKDSSVNPDITATRNYKNHKWGFVLNGAQQLNKRLGAYARLSWNDGKNETFAFTEIDRSFNAGIQWSSSTSEQSNVFGAGAAVNALSKLHRDYLAAGGYGFIIGDGQLNYGLEMIAEIYYRFNFFKGRLQASPDYQFVINPAYNKDRGPVHIFAVRTHIEF